MGDTISGLEKHGKSSSLNKSVRADCTAIRCDILVAQMTLVMLVGSSPRVDTKLGLLIAGPPSPASD